MNEGEFRGQVIDSLARVETKMDILVGSDGTGGWKAEADRRLERLEQRHLRHSGVIGLIGAAAAGAVNWAWHHFVHSQ
jgi:hypothetical protein